MGEGRDTHLSEDKDIREEDYKRVEEEEWPPGFTSRDWDGGFMSVERSVTRRVRNRVWYDIPRIIPIS